MQHVKTYFPQVGAPPAPPMVVAPEKEYTPIVLFPTVESWHQWVSTHPTAPRLRYCQYGCGGTGFFRRDVPISSPAFGKVYACQCTRERSETAQAEAARELLSKQEQTWNLANWVGSDRSAQTIARQASAQGWGLYVFWGALGVGKTGLLTAVINSALDRNIPARYYVVPELLREWRASYQDDTFDVAFETVRDTPVLALDELWRYKETEWAAERMFELVDYRYRFWDRLLTVCATNAEPDYNDALWSRFTDAKRAQIVQVRGGNVRPFTS